MPTGTPRLRWRKQPNETGLARIVQGPRGYDLWYGDRDLGSAHPLTHWPDRYTIVGYYWSVGSDKDLGIAHRNTASAPVATMEEAKAACLAYIKECLKRAETAHERA